MENNTKMLICVVCTMAFFIPLVISNAYAITFDKKDYMITNFGLKSGNPFITVQGKAGGSYDPSCGDECWDGYVFVTDKGTFQISVAEGEGSKPYYGADQLKVNSIKSGECLLTKTAHGKPSFSGNTAEYTDHNLSFGKVNKAYTMQVSADDPDSKCITGFHIVKIFSEK
jgi:hypothetical protein